jgi:hypothetical protein
MDYEDGMLIATAGERLVEVGKMKNLPMYKVFVQMCKENGEEPSTVMGLYAYRLLKEVSESDVSPLMEEILESRLNVHAMRNKRSLKDIVTELKEVRDALRGDESGIDKELDSLVVSLLKNIVDSTKSPIDKIAEQKGNEPPTLNLSEISTDELVVLLNEVRAELEDRVKAAEEVKHIDQEEVSTGESEGVHGDDGSDNVGGGQVVEDSEGDGDTEEYEELENVEVSDDSTREEADEGDDIRGKQDKDNTGSGNRY